MMGYYGYGLTRFWMIIHLMGRLLFGGLIIYAVVRLFSRGLAWDERHAKTEALSILNQRYAQGEISDEEYKHKKAMLR